MQILPSPCAVQPPFGVPRCRGAGALAKGLVSSLLAVSAHGALAISAVDVQTSRHGAAIQVHARASIKAPMDIVWTTLTDYERLPEFIPGLRKSRVIARKGATTTIEQSGVAQFLFLTVPIDVTLESTERAPHSIEVRRVAGTLRQLQGRYETQAMPEQGFVQLRWTGLIEPENRLPPLVGEAIMRQSILSQFTGMVREIERRESIRRLAAPASQPNQPLPPLHPAPSLPASPTSPPAAETTTAPATTPEPTAPSPSTAQ